MLYQGCCHCGSVGYTYETELPPAQWSLRACQCSFCRAHGACTTSDPNGTIAFFDPDGRLRRYRFGHRITDFLICGRCGVYVGAVTEHADAPLAVINANALRPRQQGVKAPSSATYDGEGIEARNRRRQRAWTPCAGVVRQPAPEGAC